MREGLTEGRGREGGGETCITRTGLRPYDTLTGFNVVSLRHTGAATLIFSRGGPVPCWEGEGREHIVKIHIVKEEGGRSVWEGKVSRGREERGNYFTVGFVS